jgi:hypothetical protein
MSKTKKKQHGDVILLTTNSVTGGSFINKLTSENQKGEYEALEQNGKDISSANTCRKFSLCVGTFLILAHLIVFAALSGTRGYFKDLIIVEQREFTSGDSIATGETFVEKDIGQGTLAFALLVVAAGIEFIVLAFRFWISFFRSGQLTSCDDPWRWVNTISVGALVSVAYAQLVGLVTLYELLIFPALFIALSVLARKHESHDCCPERYKESYWSFLRNPWPSVFGSFEFLAKLILLLATILIPAQSGSATPTYVIGAVSAVSALLLLWWLVGVFHDAWCYWQEDCTLWSFVIFRCFFSDLCRGSILIVVSWSYFAGAE